ncbi:MAG: transcription termination/antitermination protein NusG [Kiritimatiellae bacterium]|nr:transcription termination/antitermination protein NusG [Kiritimatiellia bacterium]
MKKDWFVLHTLTGQENKAQKSIIARTKLEAMEEFVGQCIIPQEKVTEKKNGKSRSFTKKFFPGYLLCELALYDEARGIDPNTGKKAIYERTWQFLRETPGVIGFVGGERPVPLKKSEMDAILSSGKGGKAEPPPRPKVNFNVGDTVKVNDGPFLGQVGTVIVVDPDRGKLTVEVQIFSRKTPVDVECWQVEKMTVEEVIESNPAI